MKQLVSMDDAVGGGPLMPKNNFPIKDAAEIMGKSQQFLRTALQQGMFDFGVAVKMSPVYTYYINREKFMAYINGK